MYLYFGYLSVQLLILINKLFQENIPMSAMVFSVVVVFIWAFIPFIGYLLAKSFKAKGKTSKHVLFTYGIGVGLIEYGLLYFDVVSNKQNTITTILVFCLFFIIAYLSTNKTELAAP